MNKKNIRKENVSGKFSAFICGVLLVIWCVVLLYTQFVTFVKISDNIPSTYYGTLPNFLNLLWQSRQIFQFNSIDLITIILIFIIPVVILFFDIRHGSCTAIWQYLTKHPVAFGVTLITIFAILSRHYLHPGNLSFSGDSANYLGQTLEVKFLLEHLSLPNYSNIFYGGWNCKLFGGNFFGLSTGLTCAIFGFPIGVKIVYWLSSIAACVGMALLVSLLTRRKYIGVLCAIAYGLNFYFFYTVVVVGGTHKCIILATLPWAFYFVEKSLLEKSKQWRYLPFSGVPILICSITHFVYGAYFFLYFSVYLLLRVMSLLRLGNHIKEAKNLAYNFIFTFLLTVGPLTQYLTQTHESMGYYYDKSHLLDIDRKVELSTLYQWFDGIVSIPIIDQQRWWHNSYFGLSVFLLSLAGLLLFRYGKRFRFNNLIYYFILTLFTINFIHVFFPLVFLRLPLAGYYFINDSLRQQVFLVFFMVLMAGYGILSLQLLVQGWLKNKQNVKYYKYVIIAVISIDVGGTTLQFPYWKIEPTLPDLTYEIKEKCQSLADKWFRKGELPAAYTFYESVSEYDYLFRSFTLSWHDLNLPSYYGTHYENAPRSAYFSELFVNYLNKVLVDTRTNATIPFPEQFISDYFFLMNYENAYFWGNIPRLYDKSFFNKINFSGNNTYVEFKHHSPLIVSSAITRHAWKEKRNVAIEELKEVIGAMKINQNDNTAEILFLDEDVTEGFPVIKTNNLLSFELLENTVKFKSNTYKLKTSQHCFVQFNKAYYTFLKVFLDDKRVRYYPSAIRTVIIDVPAGEHEIVFKSGWNTYMLWGFLLALSMILIIVFIAIFKPEGFFNHSTGKQDL